MKNLATLVLVVCIFCVQNCVCKTVNKIPLDDHCLLCICEAISGCNKSLKCDKDVCGMFRITEPYWIDAGRPEVSGEDCSTSTEAYKDCTNNEKCATKTAKKYLTTYAQDCDDNGVIDCYDYAGIHKYGGFGGCKEHCLKDSGSYYTTLDTCLNKKTPVIEC